MYLDFFGLDDYPFDGLPDRRFYYVGGSQHQSLGDHLSPYADALTASAYAHYFH